MRILNLWPKYALIVIIFLKRTVNAIDCADEESWLCDAGDECIELTDLCDGRPDCQDGSDETVKNCIKNQLIPKDLYFRCTYGAAIGKNFICNGHKDCVDGSDELPALCEQHAWRQTLKGKCSNVEMQCRYSSECIDLELICNGQANCADNTDESLEVCSNLFCPTISFRCGYGGCVNGNAACNGKNECFDASDESPVLCDAGTEIFQPLLTSVSTSLAMKVNCRIPVDKQALIVYNGITDENISLGTYVPIDIPLNFACQPGYTLTGNSNTYCLRDGNWIRSLPDCYLYCTDKHPRSGFSTKVSFEFDAVASYETEFKPGTIANIKCAHFYKKTNDFHRVMKCMENGSWYPRKKACAMSCGRTAEQVTRFSKGINTNITEVPWHVGIYRKSENIYKNICGGTIISPHFVVSAAHCFFESHHTRTTKIDYSEFSVAAGKYRQEYTREESFLPPAQKAYIIDVWIADDYNNEDDDYFGDICVIKLDRFLIFSKTVRPACLHLPAKRQPYTQSNVLGRISAFSTRTRGSGSVLQTLRVKTVLHGTCKVNLMQHANLREDKICVISFGEQACKGDSGGGFVVQMPDGNYALWGILSFSKKTQDCSAHYNVLALTSAAFYKDKLKFFRDQDLENDILFD